MPRGTPRARPPRRRPPARRRRARRAARRSRCTPPAPSAATPSRGGPSPWRATPPASRISSVSSYPSTPSAPAARVGAKANAYWFSCPAASRATSPPPPSVRRGSPIKSLPPRVSARVPSKAPSSSPSSAAETLKYPERRARRADAPTAAGRRRRVRRGEGVRQRSQAGHLGHGAAPAVRGTTPEPPRHPPPRRRRPRRHPRVARPRRHPRARGVRGVLLGGASDGASRLEVVALVALGTLLEVPLRHELDAHRRRLRANGVAFCRLAARAAARLLRLRLGNGLRLSSRGVRAFDVRSDEHPEHRAFLLRVLRAARLLGRLGGGQRERAAHRASLDRRRPPRLASRVKARAAFAALRVPEPARRRLARASSESSVSATSRATTPPSVRVAAAAAPPWAPGETPPRRGANDRKCAACSARRTSPPARFPFPDSSGAAAAATAAGGTATPSAEATSEAYAEAPAAEGALKRTRASGNLGTDAGDGFRAAPRQPRERRRVGGERDGALGGAYQRGERRHEPAVLAAKHVHLLEQNQGVLRLRARVRIVIVVGRRAFLACLVAAFVAFVARRSRADNPRRSFSRFARRRFWTSRFWTSRPRPVPARGSASPPRTARGSPRRCVCGTRSPPEP